MPAPGRYDLLIVGAGAAGLAAAEFAASLDLSVGIVERNKLGGAAMWTADLPSKALIASARLAHQMRNAGELGLEPQAGRIDTGRVWARLRRLQHEAARAPESPERLRQELGVEFHFGAAHVMSPTTVEVAGEELESRYILVCTGSRPAVPLVPGLDDTGYLTADTMWELERAPTSVVILGGGTVGVELAQALARLGVTATLLVGEPHILPAEERALVERLEERLRADGVLLHTDIALDSVRLGAGGAKLLTGAERDAPGAWRGRDIIVATGQRPNVEGLGLEDVGVELGPRGIRSDLRQRTAVPTIYAAGDCAGRFASSYSARFEAIRAVRNMFFPGRSRSPLEIPWVTHTDPELARAGLTAEVARAEHGEAAVEVLFDDFGGNDRARAEQAAGAIEIVLAKGRVVGAHVLAPGAGEVIGELALAIDQGMRAIDLANIVHASPTLAMTIQIMMAGSAQARAGRLSFLHK